MNAADSHGGSLAGLSVVEFASNGPGPFCAMMLADHGAEVVRIVRPEAPVVSAPLDERFELLHRNRSRVVELDLKSDGGRAEALGLLADADVLIEGNRPGVMERLGLGPDPLMTAHPRLVYTRITGWGQDGPYAGLVGHDVNYLSISGTLSLVGGRDEPPTIPLALVGDFGGGGMVAAFGIMAALWERERSGLGQLIDASILDGAALLATAFHGFRQGGLWSTSRQDNLVDGGAPFYRSYVTADDRWITVGALERRFYLALLALLGVEDVDVDSQHDRSRWPALGDRFGAIFRTRSRDAWVAAADGTEACLTAVLTLEEAHEDPHVVARSMLIEVDGITQPAPAPRLGRTPAGPRSGS